MAKTKAKRRRKHRGTQAGTVQRPAETHGRGRGGKASAGGRTQAREVARQRRAERLDRPPTWRSAATRAAVAAVFVAIVLIALGQLGLSSNAPTPARALLLAGVAFVLYVPLGYALDTLVYRFRQRRKGAAATPPRSGRRG